MASPIRLKTIAALSKVSISAVSRVLSNKGYVSAEVREKVLNALAELTGLDTSATSPPPRPGLRVVVLVQKEAYVDRDPMTSVDLTTLIKSLENRGHYTTLLDLDDPNDREAAASLIEKGKIDVALVSDDGVDDRAAEFLDGRGIPWIATNGYSTKRKCYYVDNDNFGGAQAVVEHLIALGHTRIGFITGHPGRWVSENRLEACRQVFARHGLPWNDRVEPGYFKLNGGFTACCALLDRDPRLTAFFAFNDLSAIGAVRALKDRGLQVPRDVSVVGFDDMEIAAFSDPPLTTVSRFHPDLNHFLVQGLENAVAYPGLAALGVLTETRLILRQSTRPV